MSKRQLPNILTDTEEIKLLSVFNRRYRTSYRNQCMVRTALETGLRVSELIALRFEDIEPATGRVHLKRAKGMKDRVIFMKPSLVSALLNQAELMDREPEGPVFTTLQGQPVKDAYLRKMIAQKAKKAGIQKRVHFHLLRHTYLTRLYSRTKDLRLVQEVAGHADISTTQIYTHISGEDVRQAMLDL